MKILICGGHPTPALAVIDEIKKRNEEHDIFFVGRKYAIETERTLSFEYKACMEGNIRFLELHAGRITRALSRSSILNFFRVPLGFIQAMQIVFREQPDVIISFGGYLALPIAFWGWIAGKKIITHEQTMRPGTANRIIGFFSRKIFVAFEQSIHFFPSSKTSWIGNPVRDVIFEQNVLPFSFPTGLPVIYVTGGSLGSHSINEHIFSILPRLLSVCSVIHQTGDVKEYGDFESAKKIQKQLEKKSGGVYIPVKHVSDKEVGSVYHRADCVVARSGANTFFELLALQKPAILIPLPWSANDEQRAHAEFFVSHDIGELFDQKQDSETLLIFIKKMLSSLALYQVHFTQLPFELKRDAASTIVSEALR